MSLYNFNIALLNVVRKHEDEETIGLWYFSLGSNVQSKFWQQEGEDEWQKETA